MFDPEKITYFGETDARNKKVSFGIKAKDRTRHVYIIGKTGMGKSTLLENMAVQDIQNGEGLAFIDPHGKTADLLLEYVPKERIKDVIYFAPFDTDYPVSFNVMEDVGPEKRHLVSNGLLSAFKKIWVDAWSARMEYILNNTILALLEYPDSTLIGINRMLADKEYRNKVVANIKDPSVKSFWVDEFAKYGERYMQEAGAAIQNKVGQFVANPLVRNIIGQPKSSFDLREVMDKGKIIIINLSKGRVGEANANLLGSMIITKIYLAALSRADVSDKRLHELPNFYLYVDEFQSFANESFADILSEARKYKLNLTIAHQYIEQMSEEVRAAVFGNVGTMITFRVGAYDAEVLEKEFAPVFTAEDLVNLGFIQIYLKLMIDGVSSPPFSATTLPPIDRPEISFKDDIITSTRNVFARPRSIVDAEIRAWHEEGSEKRERVGERRQDDRRNFNNKGDVKREKKAMFEEMIREEKVNFKPSPERGVPLETLKQVNNNNKRKDNKTPTQEHVSELKQALAALTQNGTHDAGSGGNKNQTAESKVTHTEPHTQKHPEQPKEQVKNHKPKEVPEEELKKLLHVDS
jgi:energy-coupling factor transporter ATP-binding protein EcfA2